MIFLLWGTFTKNKSARPVAGIADIVHAVLADSNRFIVTKEMKWNVNELK